MKRDFLRGAILTTSILFGSSLLVSSEDCASQNIYFPLGDGFSWSYTITAVDENGTHSLASRVVCTITGRSSSGITGQLTEPLSGLPEAEADLTTLFKLENGAVYTVEPTMYVSWAEGSGTVKDKLSQFQLYLPAMGALATGTAWSRRGGVVYTAVTPQVTGKMEGLYQEQDMGQVLGIEKVTVPAGAFTALKVQKVLSVQVAGEASSTIYVLWFTPGIGLVKEMALDGTYTKELSSYRVTPCCGFVITAVSGDARVNGSPAAAGMGVPGKSQVSVPWGGRLDLIEGNGSQVRIGGGTEASLETLCADSPKGPGSRTIRLIRGLVLMTLNKIFSSREFKVDTPTCVIGDLGTEFSVEVKEEAGRPRTAVEVFSGEVWVKNKANGSETVLQAGARQVF